ncbi:MAG: SIS domain-containing protein [Lachnospiraceae bacterium]|nr:SIS domain-containing protein [Lachnospiraceae bacterium]
MFFDNYTDMLKTTLDGVKRDDIQKLFDLIEETREKGKRLFVLGNGGSAAAASHWVCDFGKGINTEGSKRLKIVSLVDNTAVFSALGNDFGYDTTFSEQMKNLLEPDDLVLTFSVSGSSPNLVEAHRYANSIGAKTACVVADKGGRIIGMSDFAMIIPSENYGVVEDIHMILGHAISQKIRAVNEVA